jgi:hypothetical protein
MLEPSFFPDELHSLFSRRSTPKVKIEDDIIDLSKIEKMAEEEVSRYLISREKKRYPRMVKAMWKIIASLKIQILAKKMTTKWIITMKIWTL